MDSEDSCIDSPENQTRVTSGQYLGEFYCSNNKANMALYKCNYGCTNGACNVGWWFGGVDELQVSLGCSETDNGQDYAIRGSVNGTDIFGNSYSYTDNCFTSNVESGSANNYLQEFYCNGTQYQTEARSCGSGSSCVDGACTGSSGSGTAISASGEGASPTSLGASNVMGIGTENSLPSGSTTNSGTTNLLDNSGGSAQLTRVCTGAINLTQYYRCTALEISSNICNSTGRQLYGCPEGKVCNQGGCVSPTDISGGVIKELNLFTGYAISDSTESCNYKTIIPGDYGIKIVDATNTSRMSNMQNIKIN